jgi:hypothetical protein
VGLGGEGGAYRIGRRSARCRCILSRRGEGRRPFLQSCVRPCISRYHLERERACVLSTMSSSIADVKKACGGRSTGRTCCGGGPLAPPSTFGPCCGGGVALYTPPYPASARQSSCPSAPLEVLATSPIEDDGRCGASTPSSCWPGSCRERWSMALKSGPAVGGAPAGPPWGCWRWLEDMVCMCSGWQ